MIRRFLALCIDSALLLIVYLSLGLLINLIGLGEWVKYVTFPLYYTIFLLKDVGGQSVGKKVMHLKIVKVGSERKLKWYNTVLRNFMLNFLIVEAILVLMKKDRRRLGDMVTGTKVIIAK